MTDNDLDALLALGEALASDCDNTDGWEDGAATIRALIAAIRAKTWKTSSPMTNPTLHP